MPACRYWWRQSVATNVPVQIDPPPVGHVMPISTVTVHSQIGGIIRQVNFKEGDEVKSNALLFTIDPRPTQAALDQARANLERDSGQWEYQKANYLRDQKLLDGKNYFAGSIGHGQSQPRRGHRHHGGGQGGHHQRALESGIL